MADNNPILVEIEGIENPVSFEAGTPIDIIQSKVKELITGKDIRTGEKIGAITEPPTFREEVTTAVKEELPQAVGGIATGLAAAGAGLGVAPTVGLVGLGGGGGEAMKQIGQHLSGSPAAPKTSIEAAKRIGAAGFEEGTFELIGGLAAKSVRKILAPFRRTVSAGANEVSQFFKNKIGPLVLLPSEATESRTLDLLGNVAESSIIGGNVISEFKTNRIKFFDDFADSMIDEFGQRTDPEDIGNLFVAAVEGKKKVHSKAAEILYNNVADVIGDEPVQVPTSSLKSFIKPLRKISEELGSIEAKNAGDDLIATIDDLPDTLTFNAARELRSRLISRIDEFSVINKKAPAIGKAKRMIGLVDEAITTSLKATNPEALDAWRTANQFWKQGQEQFNNTMIRRLVKMAEETGTGAEMIAPAVFRPGQVSRVRKVKSAMNPATWNKMQGYFMEHLIQKSTDVDGVIKGKRLLNHISGKPGSFGMPMLQETFTPQQIKSLQMLGKGLEFAQNRQSEGAGKMLVQLSQAGAIGSILTGNLQVPAATIILGPALVGKMMTNSHSAKLLTQGIQLPANSEAAAGLMARLVAASGRIKGRTDDDEK